MRYLIVLACVVALACGDRMGAYNDMKRKLDKYNLFTQCFGDKATLQYFQSIKEANDYCKENPSGEDYLNAIDGLTADEELFDSLRGLLDSPAVGRFARNKRDTVEEELKEEVAEHREEMRAKVDRLSCVLKKMKWLDEKGEIKTWAYEDLKSYMVKTPIGKDDEMLQKMSNMFQDCYDISEAWPQTMLDRHPLMKIFGRKKIYFECRSKGLIEVCYKWQLYQGMKLSYGIDTADTDLGLYGDKFEQAKSAWILGFEHLDEEYKFVNDFFWSQNRD
jgi:hypothetical protein